MLRIIPDQNQESQEKTKSGMINSRGEQGWNALHWAVYLGYSEVLNEFLTFDIDVNLATTDGWTPLQLAIYKNQVASKNIRGSLVK